MSNDIIEKVDENGDRYWTDGKKVVYDKDITRLIQEIADADEALWNSHDALVQLDPRFKNDIKRDN